MLDDDIIKSAKSIIQSKAKSKEADGAYQSLKDDMTSLFAKLERMMDERFHLLEDRLEAIIKKRNF